MIKKNRKWIVGVLSFCLICCLSLPIPVFATSPLLLLSGATINKTNGICIVASQNARHIWVINVEDFDGVCTLSFNSTSYGRYVISSDDNPSDIAIGYTFISSDYHDINGVTSIDISVSNTKYIYVAGQNSFTYTLTSNIPVPTPTFTPTTSATPTGTGGNGIPLNYDIPFDYYMIAIIILLGGILICQLFKN